MTFLPHGAANKMSFYTRDPGPARLFRPPRTYYSKPEIWPCPRFNAVSFITGQKAFTAALADAAIIVFVWRRLNALIDLITHREKRYTPLNTRDETVLAHLEDWVLPWHFCRA